jgi:hypothetical protein
MIHGNVSSEFKKLVNQTATPHLNETLLRVAAIMGPADAPNPSIPSGWTYFGQFVDHDLTFDKEGGINSRTPIFDLDSLYGKGPSSSEHGHHFEGAVGSETFKIGNQTNRFGDLSRDGNFVAQIPDPRNDENIIVASLQLLFQVFHNALVIQQGLDFEKAKRAVSWHYQSIVRFDFLPRIVGRSKLIEIEKDGRKLFTASQMGDVFMPTEYSGACYRFGHSMVRERYSFNEFFNDTRSNPNIFFGFPGGRPVKGGHQITEIWTLQGNGNSLVRFFDPTILNPQLDADNFSGRIDTKLPSVLFNLEVEPGQNNVLAHRNLVSGQRLGLANGQQVAVALQNLGVSVTPLSESEIIAGGAPSEIGLNTPLWYYVLKEGEVQNGGEHLGDVGGTIVAETIVGLLESDPESFLNRSTDWPFKVGDSTSDRVSMLELIQFVDVVQAIA